MSNPQGTAPAADRPGWAILFAILTWAASLGLVLIFWLFWRIVSGPTHGIWALATTGAVLACGALTALAAGRQIVRGPGRTLAAAVVLLGTTPIVWCGLFVGNLYVNAVNRQTIRFDVPTCIAAFWFSSVGDLEARWRYPRWTNGRHAVLLDDGQTPEPTKLVAEMDKHIEQMAGNFDAPLPAVPARWVRGPLLGQHGQAVINWAVCDTHDHAAELTYLDRHEMAHVIITMMGGPDQDPSMLLAEGWAESQSKNRADLIETLADEQQRDTNYSLQELINPDWYGRSAGPVYTHGGPFVLYVIERYGPQNFLSFYHGVRHESFPADCERILGDSWPVVEQQFWQWLSIEAAKLQAAAAKSAQPPSETAATVTLAEAVNPRDWQTILAGYRATWGNRSPVPVRCAVAIDSDMTEAKTDRKSEPATYKEISECVIDGDDVWQLDSSQPSGNTYCTLSKPGLAVEYDILANGRVSESDDRISRKSALLDARELLGIFTNSADLAHFLPVDPQRRYDRSTKIVAIRPPATAADSRWKIDFTQGASGDADESSCRLVIDAAADWSVESRVQTSGKHHLKSRYTLKNIFGRVASIESTTRDASDRGIWTAHKRLRELDEAESQRVRERVEAIARRGATLNSYGSPIRPLTLAIAWPAIGVLLLAADVVSRKRNRTIP